MIRVPNYLFACAFAATLISSCSSDRLSREDVRKEFERDSGFKLPSSATQIEGLSGNEDSHGDYSTVLTFVVPLDEVAAFTKLPPSVWLHPENLKALQATKDFARDVSLPSNSNYQMPAGSLYIDQWGRENRKLAINTSTGRIIYARQMY